MDLRFDRNFLRNEIVPRLKARWPGLVATSGRSARHCASAAGLADEIAATDLDTCGGENSYRLSLDAITRLSQSRQENLLRNWVAGHKLETPNSHKIRRILSEVMVARADADPVVTWAGIQVRRFGRELYLLPRLPAEATGWSSPWNGNEGLVLPEGLGELKLVKAGSGFKNDVLTAGRVSVGFRREGLQCTPSGRSGSRSFKRLMQDFSVPPWLRNRVPLLFVDDKLAAVGDVCLCEPYGKEDLELEWKRDRFL